ncbi:MAG: RagB/SusD family nutrient uptake outer membrane protein [Bacteroidales bacterium]|nr:RagB/SusD family nutrient uptake outer membrane protein [Bacteroidales bacterium]
MKKILYSIVFCLVAVLAMSCDALNQYPHQETTSEDVYKSFENYKAVLGKLYVSFVITGQGKGGDNADLSSYNGYDFTRCLFNVQECCTDEVVYTWLEGDQMGGLTYINWDVNDIWVSDTYYRIYYNIALCNEFLRNAADDKISGFTSSEQDEIRIYRAEARFLRAFCYYHALDLYRNIPFVTEDDPVGNYVPPRYTGEQIFEFIEDELIDCVEDMLDRSACEYGRACKQAAYALLARLYLNAEVYTGTARWTDCITYCNEVINAGYTLESDYFKLFNADNHRRTNELIFTFPIDAEHTVSWGATTYIICGGINNASDTQVPADYGCEVGWGNYRLRGELPTLFTDGDLRGKFYTEGQTLTIDVVENQAYGYLPEKFTNLTDDGLAASNTADGGCSTDFPVFRLADVYLMLAEAVVMGGSGSSIDTALGYVNALRERAFGNTSGNIVEYALTADFILDERGRELYLECTRRTDLIRHNKFTTADYIWQWKGGTIDGQAVDSKYNIFPIPATELTANPNLYNDNY